MSPRVSITIALGDLAELRKEARVHAAEALAAARAAGIPLRRSHPGVAPGMVDWHLDGHHHQRGVTLAGAVLLHLQPEPVEAEGVLEAAARALGASLTWVAGAEAGWAGELEDAVRLAGPDGQLYRHGYEVGEALLRHLGYGL